MVSRAKPVRDDDDALQSSGTDVDPRLARYLDDETSAIFARLDEEALEERNHRNEPTPQGEVSAQHVAELESEVDRLAEELEQTRRDGRSSPFSKEFVKLRDVASQKDDEIRALIDALTDRDSQVSIVRRKLSELVKRFAGPEGSEVEAQDELQALSEELDESRAKSRELAEQLDATEREHKQEIADLAKRLVNTQRDRDQGQDAAKTLRAVSKASNPRSEKYASVRQNRRSNATAKTSQSASSPPSRTRSKRSVQSSRGSSKVSRSNTMSSRANGRDAARTRVELENGLSELPASKHANELQEHKANQKSELKEARKDSHGRTRKTAAMTELKKKLDTGCESEMSHTRALAASRDEHGAEELEWVVDRNSRPVSNAMKRGEAARHRGNPTSSRGSVQEERQRPQAVGRTARGPASACGKQAHRGSHVARRTL